VRSFFQRNEVIAEHQMRRDLCKQVVVQLEIMQVDEIAAISTRNVLRPFKLIGTVCCSHLPVSSAHKHRFLFRHAAHSEPAPDALVNARSQCKYRQVKRNQDSAYKHSHDDQYDW